MERREYWSKWNVLDISMDLNRQALQTNGKFFFQILESFFELVAIF